MSFAVRNPPSENQAIEVLDKANLFRATSQLANKSETSVNKSFPHTEADRISEALLSRPRWQKTRMSLLKTSNPNLEQEPQDGIGYTDNRGGTSLADVRDQGGFGSDDFHMELVNQLRSLADRAGVSKNIPGECAIAFQKALDMNVEVEMTTKEPDWYEDIQNCAKQFGDEETKKKLALFRDYMAGENMAVWNQYSAVRSGVSKNECAIAFQKMLNMNVKIEMKANAVYWRTEIQKCIDQFGEGEEKKKLKRFRDYMVDENIEVWRQYMILLRRLWQVT